MPKALSHHTLRRDPTDISPTWVNVSAGPALVVSVMIAGHTLPERSRPGRSRLRECGRRALRVGND